MSTERDSTHRTSDGKVTINNTEASSPEIRSKETWKVSTVFYLLGMMTMLPWNFFITADTYWQYKLRNTSLSDSEWNDPDVPLTPYQVSFTPTLVLVSNVSMFLFTFVASALVLRTREESRMYASFLGSLVAMGIITVFSVVNTDEWQSVFYGVTMTAVALLNVGISIIQASLFGLAGFFQAKSMAALISGCAVAGIASSLSRIISLAIGEEDPVVSGILYFVAADFFIVISTVAYFYLTTLGIYKDVKKRLETKIKSQRESTRRITWVDFRRHWNTFVKISRMGFTLAFTFLISVSVFPAVTVYITSSLPPSSWSDVYFQPTATFLVYNVFDALGRELTGYIHWPGEKGWLLPILASLRLVFIPLLLLCHGDSKSFPTLFYYDSYYFVINILFAVSNGYYGSLAMVYYPRLVDEEETEFAGSLMAIMLSLGLVLGSLLSPVFVLIWGPNV